MNETLELIKDPKYFLCKSSGFYFIFCIVINLICSILFAIFHFLFTDTMIFVLNTLIPYSIMLILLFAFLQGYHVWGSMGFHIPKFRSFFLTLPVVLAVYPFLLWVSEFCHFLAPKSMLNFSDSTEFVLHQIGFLGGFILLAVIPGVVEECICRGFIYGVFRNRSFFVATVVSTLCFSLLHMNLDQVVYAALFGILLCLIREITGSIYPCMFAHVIFNSFSVVSFYLMNTDLNSDVSEETAVAVHTFSDFMTTYQSLLLIGLLGLMIAIVVLFVMKKIEHFSFSKIVDRTYPVLSWTYVVGWTICILLGYVLM